MTGEAAGAGEARHGSDRHALPPGFWRRVVLLVLRRPGLWRTAARQAVRLAGPGWWRSAPFLPVPDPGYLRFRVETAYGRDLDLARAEDVVEYLEWCRSFPA